MISALIAYQVALLTWSLYPAQESTYIWTPPSKVSTKNNSKLNSDKLQEQNLFGQYQNVVLGDEETDFTYGGIIPISQSFYALSWHYG